MFGRFVYLKDVVTLDLDLDRCTGCGTCLSVCPHAVFVQDNGKVRVDDRDACMECGACARNCPVEAVTVVSGVGCAAAVINTALGRTSDNACCVIEPSSGSIGCSAKPDKKKAAGCC
jgi:NAD-dependent dihydropyrimidine dehydrogenase PreA subunit